MGAGIFVYFIRSVSLAPLTVPDPSRCSINKEVNALVILLYEAISPCKLQFIYNPLHTPLSLQLTAAHKVNCAWQNSLSSEPLDALLGQQRLCFS